jgi:integrase/recombinase XerC
MPAKSKSMFRSQPAQAPATVGRKGLAGALTREMMLDHYEQHLQTATNRNGRPFDAKTIRSYMHASRLLARFLDGQEISGDLTPACDPRVLNAFLRSYLAGHSQNGTANIQRNLRTMFNWLEVETEIESPYRSRVLDRYRPRETKPKTLTGDFIRELLADCKGHGFTDVRDRAIVRLMLDGMRVAELAEIEPHEVPTLAGSVVRLKPKKAERRYAEDSGRRVLLDQETVKALHRWLRTRESHPLARTALADHLWLGKGSATPFGYNGIRLMLIRRCKRLGYEVHVTPHMFRHTFAHDFREQGGAIDDLAEHMGWAGLEMARRYGKDMAEDRAIRARRNIGRMY